MIVALHRCTNLSLSHPLRQAALSGARKTVVAQQNLGHLSVMMRYAVLSLQRLVLVAALTVALVATGFAHRLPSTDDAALAAYALAGGDIAELCGDLDGDGLPDHGDCPACQIAGGADLPPTTLTLRDADLAFVAQVVAPRESRAVRAVLDPARGLRAPPLA
jgi:hypothetical protein